MRQPLSRRNGMKITMKRSSIAVSAIAVALIGAGILMWRQNGAAKNSAQYSTQEQSLINQSVQEIVKDYARIKLYDKTVRIGEVFPVPPFAAFEGRASPNWEQPMVLTFGGEFAPGVKYLFNRLVGEHIQLVHVVYLQDFSLPLASVALEQIASFPKKASVLDGYSARSSVIEYLRKVGISSAGYAFVLGPNRRIVYASNTIGLDTDEVESAVKEYVKSKGESAPHSSETILTSGQQLPLSAIPAALRTMLEPELLKKRAVVIAVSLSECNLCGPNYTNTALEYASRWTKHGVGVIMLRGNQRYTTIGRNADGVVTIDDGLSANRLRSPIFRAWNVRGYPSVMVLREGKIDGFVPFRSWNFTSGRSVEDIQIRAIDKILSMP